MLRASREMGFGEDWKKALEAVKNKYVEPGQMIYLVRDLSREAVEFLEKRELVTLPPCSKRTIGRGHDATDATGESSSHRRRDYPSKLSGISQTLTEKLEALRGNNMFFARATVSMSSFPATTCSNTWTQRYRTYRSISARRSGAKDGVLLGDAAVGSRVHQDPGTARGALVWRMHRCARIIFSLSFHLGR